MLFVDVRGSSRLAEQMTAANFSALMNRFYKAATDVLIRTDGVIDKLVGDAVIGLYLPIFTGPNHARPAVLAAQELLMITGHAEEEGPWLPIGIGVHTGIAFVGTVSGAEDTVSDITALGDNVNVTARLASMAVSGEALISETTYAAGGEDFGELEQRRLELRGRSESISARVLRV
ncbi:MAG TPA: adenylate/guanylate cyclase domain-containing protein [Gemmatimonadota bacterium]|nr:adenylate/guanylate cyclase domain-containing protein [Gemmatimonadota bacterium]